VTYSRRATRYKVRKGDTLASIADDFGVPVERLKRWNGIRAQRLRPGRVLLIHLPSGSAQPQVSASRKAPKRRKSSSIQATRAAANKPGSKPVYHKVKRGETLTAIANSYNTTVSALRRDNAKAASNLRAGDVLLIRETR
jgi:LysM repeat protein